MSHKKKKICYDGLMKKLDSMDAAVSKMREGLNALKTTLSNAPKDVEEVCPDEVESELALLEAIQDLCLEGLLEREPEGDA